MGDRTGKRGRGRENEENEKAGEWKENGKKGTEQKQKEERKGEQDAK